MRGSPLALDLDGTLIGCRERHVELAAQLALELGGVSLDRDVFWEHKRNGASTAQSLTRVGVAPELVAEIASAWVGQIEQPQWLERDCLMPEVTEVLAALRTMDVVPFIVTARQDAGAVLRQLGRLGLGALVANTTVVSPFNAAAEKAEALTRIVATGFIGDTELDASAARAAGVPFAAVSSGQRSERFLRSAGVAFVHSHLRSAVARLVRPQWTSLGSA